MTANPALPVRLPFPSAAREAGKAHAIAFLAGAGFVAYLWLVVATGFFGSLLESFSGIVEATGASPTPPSEYQLSRDDADRDLAIIVSTVALASVYVRTVGVAWWYTCKQNGYPPLLAVPLSITFALAFFLGGAIVALAWRHFPGAS